MPVPVSLRSVAIGYGSTAVVKDFDLEIAAGEFLVLLGPSGCGKSTLLNAIAGLSDLSDGEIWIGERNVTWADPKDRGIGMVFQSYALYPNMNVEKNLSFGLQVAGMAKDEIARRVKRTAAILQLEPYLQRRPAALSGGQRQRVAIGRALVRDVDIFLFDEPLSNLDAKLRTELRVEIKKLHQELGSTMIYVTHDQVEAMTLADRIAIMRDGVIQQLASPREIYHRPANLFVAGFIGSPAMNLVSGALVPKAGKTFFRSELGTFELPQSAPQSAEERAVIAGLRPEQIVLGTASGLPGFAAKVSVIEAMGPDTILWCEAESGVFSLRMPGDFAGAVGDSVTLGLDLANASYFDSASGKRL
ncbi:Small molecules transporter [Devosia sp. LC5]|uniref:ABC transporter ATP-binding protein n=1 Tax=Devosia sp. LC5 TaxID=1502724 RepID=UPI0004E3C5C1|nr:ABC transporter ATP-binding protein [Devosia sp. LC5]KFC66680.1 Small molecules transporter [Devosia sp. LC5]